MTNSTFLGNENTAVHLAYNYSFAFVTDYNQSHLLIADHALFEIQFGLF